MRKLISDKARHRFELVAAALVAVLALWIAGGFVMAGACLGIAPPPPVLSMRPIPTCADSLPKSQALARALVLLVVGGALVVVMDRELRR